MRSNFRTGTSPNLLLFWVHPICDIFKFESKSFCIIVLFHFFIVFFLFVFFVVVVFAFDYKNFCFSKSITANLIVFLDETDEIEAPKKFDFSRQNKCRKI